MRSGHNITPSAERLADGVVQSVNVALAAAGCIVLDVLAGTHASPRRLAALTVYGAGLLAMVGASALYAWARGGHRHRLYRHLDHAAIFLMIAGTYTPFALISFDGVYGRRLLALIWAAMRMIDLAPWSRSSIGFDRLFDILENARRSEQADNYPPYNIEKTSDDSYRITRIASPEMLPEADPLPHVTCSRAACLGSGDGADRYGNTRRVGRCTDGAIHREQPERARAYPG